MGCGYLPTNVRWVSDEWDGCQVRVWYLPTNVGGGVDLHV